MGMERLNHLPKVTQYISDRITGEAFCAVVLLPLPSP